MMPSTTAETPVRPVVAQKPKGAPKSARLPGLEALRWVAAICVLLYHTPVIFGSRPYVFAKGYLGVDLFFILSGYVMARSFESKPATAQAAGKFILDRYLRMLPIMALGGVIGLPLLWYRVHDAGQFAAIALANLLLLPVSFQREAFPLNVPAWTIIYILLGNLLHRLVFSRLRGISLVLAITVSMMVAGWAAALAGSLNVGARPETMLLALPRLLLGYLIGIGLRQSWGDAPPITVPPLLGLVAMPLLLAAAWWYGVTSWLFDMAFVVVACPLIIAGAMQLQTGARLAIFAGAWSFPLYAIHFPLLIRLRNNGWVAWQAAAIALTLSALATWLEMVIRQKLKPAAGA